ncbi:TPA: glycoside hydrolase family 43 protein [Enterobacter ludwigii]
MSTIHNPLLPGFNPDPSIIEANGAFYIATSTFQWFPGICIYKSFDLKNWKLISCPLNRLSQLDMKGNPDSGGIFAPCLSEDKGIFYLVYTDVKSLSGRFWDTHNYIVTTHDIEGEWSKPVYVNSRGIDPSLFHKKDGTKWLVSMEMSYRDGGKAGFPRWNGIILQQYDEKEQKVTGETLKIYAGSRLGTTEGPHIYEHGGWYYLMTAEGGTFYNHGVTMARARRLEGPYETDPGGQMLTARYDCRLPLQRTGHADLIRTASDEWFMVHLCGRPLPSRGRSPMGRETAIQKVYWSEDGWLRLSNEKNTPEMIVHTRLTERPWPETASRDDFDSPNLALHYHTLRVPLPESVCTLTARKGWLRLYGKESLSSLHTQSLIARRQTDFAYRAQTCLDFNPRSFQQMAGLTTIYDTAGYIYLYVSVGENGKRTVNLLINDLNTFSHPAGPGIDIESELPVYLRVDVRHDAAFYYYSLDEQNWHSVGDYVEYSKLSDEYYKERGYERFTGTFVGLCCQDFTGENVHADFDYFLYEPLS